MEKRCCKAGCSRMFEAQTSVCPQDIWITCGLLTSNRIDMRIICEKPWTSVVFFSFSWRNMIELWIMVFCNDQWTFLYRSFSAFLHIQNSIQIHRARQGGRFKSLCIFNACVDGTRDLSRVLRSSSKIDSTPYYPLLTWKKKHFSIQFIIES